MNISHDEHGAVDVDELMAIHHAKMERRMDAQGKYTESEDKEHESTVDLGLSHQTTVGSQECVGNRGKRPNSLWAVVRAADKNTRGQVRRPLYAEVVAE